MPTASAVPAPGVATAAAGARAALLRPPAWLTAVADGARVAGELAGTLPGAAPGGTSRPVRVAGCELLDLRARGPLWKVRYRVTLVAASGERTDVVLAGDAGPPDVVPTAGSGAAPTTAPTAGGETTPAAGPAATATVATGEPGSAEWCVSSPALGLRLHAEVTDRRLPAAALLLDPVTARDLIAECLAGSLPGVHPAGCVPTAVRYLYGARCTVVYRLTYDSDPDPDADPDPGPDPGVGRAGRDRPGAVVAKAHADGEGAGVHAVMRALWATPLARGDVVRLARPLGYLPGPGVLLQTALPGDRTMREVLADVASGGDPAPATALLRGVADGLVALHGCEVRGVPTRTWAGDLERARRTVARLEPTWPAAARSLAALLDALADRAARTSPDTPARPSHGAFRPSQVLVDGDRIGFLDLDGCCLAEPERDVGRFTKSVAKALLPPAQAPPAAHARARVLARELTGAFVERYAARAPLDRGRVALWEALDVVAGLAHAAATLRPGVEPLLRMLDDLPPDGAEPRLGALPGAHPGAVPA